MVRQYGGKEVVMVMRWRQRDGQEVEARRSGDDKM